jgi:hypothetical protein
MMHIAGVDVKPLDDLLGEQEALEAQGKQIPKQLNENLSSAAAARLESLKQAGARAKKPLQQLPNPSKRCNRKGAKRQPELTQVWKPTLKNLVRRIRS